MKTYKIFFEEQVTKEHKITGSNLMTPKVYKEEGLMCLVEAESAHLAITKMREELDKKSEEKKTFIIRDIVILEK